MHKNTNRTNRIDEEFKREISTIINYELKDPHMTSMVSVMSVKVTPDLRYAKVYVSILDTKNKKNTLAILKKSAGFIRAELAKKINLRVTPELVFELDESMEYGSKIDNILKEIMKDVKPTDNDQ